MGICERSSTSLARTLSGRSSRRDLSLRMSSSVGSWSGTPGRLACYASTRSRTRMRPNSVCSADTSGLLLTSPFCGVLSSQPQAILAVLSSGLRPLPALPTSALGNLEAVSSLCLPPVFPTLFWSFSGQGDPEAIRLRLREKRVGDPSTRPPTPSPRMGTSLEARSHSMYPWVLSQESGCPISPGSD